MTNKILGILVVITLVTLVLAFRTNKDVTTIKAKNIDVITIEAPKLKKMKKGASIIIEVPSKDDEFRADSIQVIKLN